MREIKFRAWDGERMREVASIGWVDGVLDYISTPKRSAPADDFTLMQFTGLKDKNGKEIYEGDIYRRTVSIDGKDVVLGGGTPWCENRDVVKFEVFSENGNAGYSLPKCSSVEIIGNIYENSELLP